MITKVSTKDMPHEEWLERRRKSIGGSDAGAVLGLNKYTSPYALWAEKTGAVIPDDISDKESVRLGNDLEEYVAQRWMEATGKKLRKDNHIYTNTDYPFAHANIDRAVVGEKAGFEAKTTSSWDIVQQCREGNYPDTWYTQMVHYMMVTGLERWYLGVLCLGKGFYEFTIERDEAEIAALAAEEERFWNHVVTNTPPALDGAESTTEALTVILGDSNPGSSVDLAGVSSYLSMYQRTKEQLDKLQTELDEYKNHIMQYMGNAEKGSYGDVSISYKSQSRKTFDRKAFEAANGKIPDCYFKESTSRPFKVTVKKSK